MFAFPTGRLDNRRPAATAFRRTKDIQVSGPSDNLTNQPQFVWAGSPPATAPTPAEGASEVASLLRELVGTTRELLETARQQLEFSKRWEQRTLEQQQSQRDEFQRLLREHPELRGRGKSVEENVNAVVGKALTDLFDYVEHHGSDLTDSDYIRSELVEKYGGLLYHLYGIHGIVKRVSAFENQQQQQQQQAPPKPPGT